MIKENLLFEMFFKGEYHFGDVVQFSSGALSYGGGFSCFNTSFKWYSRGIFSSTSKKEHSSSSGWDAGQEVSKLTFETQQLPWGRVELPSLTPAAAGDMKDKITYTVIFYCGHTGTH